MNFFKTEELANEYGISERTVQRWIKWAKSGKIKLTLHTIGKRSFIVDTPENELTIKQLLSTNKKYKNKVGLQVIEPKKEFYQLFNESQIIDIVNNLEIFRELPHKYCFFNGGAKYWDKYMNRVLSTNQQITVKSTIELLNFDKEYLFSLVKDFDSINVVDIGPGNGAPIKEFLESKIIKEKLNKYIGIDFSPDILDFTEKNLKSWFGSKFPFEGHVRDVTRDSFQELLFKNTHKPDSEEVDSVNLVFFVGSTIENERHYDKTLSHILSCLGKKDIFILGQLLDTEKARIYINFQPKGEVKEEDLDVEKLIFALTELMNIKEEYYEIERIYSEKERARVIKLRFKNDIEIKIQTPSIKKNIHLPAKSKITIFRHNHHTYKEVVNKLTDIGFEILKTSVSLDKQQILAISQVKSVD